MTDLDNVHLDRTFRLYNSAQANAYADHRASYSSDLCGAILRYHTSKQKDDTIETLLDVGCGPGNATRDLAAHCTHATGLDPSTEMIVRAKEIGGLTKAGNEIRFEIASAEELDTAKTVATGTVDILTAAMAAHWFQMDTFWVQAARMVKSSGTVALWTKSSLYCHPSTPNAQAVQKALSHLENDILRSFELPSNKLSRDLYEDLILPWLANPPVMAFPQTSFIRREWNRDGQLEPGKIDFFDGSEEVTFVGLEQVLGTASMVSRWREAYPDLVGTKEDCVRVTIKDVAAAMGLNKIDAQSTLRVGSATALLLFTRN